MCFSGAISKTLPLSRKHIFESNTVHLANGKSKTIKMAATNLNISIFKKTSICIKELWLNFLMCNNGIAVKS